MWLSIRCTRHSKVQVRRTQHTKYVLYTFIARHCDLRFSCGSTPYANTHKRKLSACATHKNARFTAVTRYAIRVGVPHTSHTNACNIHMFICMCVYCTQQFYSWTRQSSRQSQNPRRKLQTLIKNHTQNTHFDTGETHTKTQCLLGRHRELRVADDLFDKTVAGELDGGRRQIGEFIFGGDLSRLTRQPVLTQMSEQSSLLSLLI